MSFSPTSLELMPGVYHLREYSDIPVFATLIVGNTKALLLDTGYGGSDWLKKAVASLTELPYDVVLSHFHSDHSYGVWQFSHAWIHPKDLELCYQAYSSEKLGDVWDTQQHLRHFCSRDEYRQHECCPLSALKEDQVFDLGGLTAQVIPISGHTPGSIGLFLREKKLLLAGDAANPHFYLFFPYSL